LHGWIFEEEIKASRGKSSEALPDVLLRLSTGDKAVECGGAYRKDRLEQFHRYCEKRALPYEIW
jgi:hypothetical protein